MNEKNINSNQEDTNVPCIPLVDYLHITKESVCFIKNNLHEEIDTSIYVTFCNFLYTVDSVYDEKHFTIWNSNTLFHNEFQISQLIIKKLNNEYNFSLNTNHAAKITKLIIAAKFSFSLEDTDKMLIMMLEICKLVKYKFMSGFASYSVTLHSFIEHIKFLAQRILTNTKSFSNTEEWDEPFIKKYHLAYDCAQNIRFFIHKKYDFILTQTEILFLTIHIHLLVYRAKN
ncbi:MAG: PRD domain-containing protein [Coprobacillaceae bacterium]